MKTNLNSIIKFFNFLLNNQSRQYEWDNSGIQIYLGNKEITTVGFALDPSKSVIEQAIEEGCELLITHHPFFFSGLKNIDCDSTIGEKTILAIQNNLSILSYHTSYDLADYGLNDFIADKLGAKIDSNFIEEGEESYYKFVIFVPEKDSERLVKIIGENGGGQIGNYSHCTFSSQGIGTFKPLENSNPYIGKQGKLEKVNEVRIETIVLKNDLNRLVAASLKAHPYEEPAYDIYPLSLGKSYGLGRICSFSEELTIEDFLKLISKKLNVENIRHNCHDIGDKFQKFAVVTGSGASLWKKCLKKNINVFLTGDLKYHEALDAIEENINIIDLGHFETEILFTEYVSDILKKEFDVDIVLLKEDSKIKTWRQ
jgi:dinuclear metal center YbgI/SA1388 family protein